MPASLPIWAYILGFTAALYAVSIARAWWRERREKRDAKAAIDAWNGRQPPIVDPTIEQLADLERRLPGLALPALILSAEGETAVTAGGTRIGGPVWLANGADWPVGRDGRCLEFVAQLDFATMPPLPDYPEAGLLQLFVGRDDYFGADFDMPDRCDIHLSWHPKGAVGGQLVQPPRLPRYGDPDDDGHNYTPFAADRWRDEGSMMRASQVMMMPQPFTRPFEALMNEIGIDPRSSSADALLERLWNELPPRGHHVGGHPAFTQRDYRLDIAYPPEDMGEPSPYRDYDRLLFQLTSDNGLCWGDVGEANVMIRRADLIARDFSRAIFYWDCS